MVSVGIPKLCLWDLIFVDPGGKDQRRLLPWHAPVTAAVARDVWRVRRFLFQQNSAPAHRSRHTVRFLEQLTPAFITPDLWLPNSTEFSPVDYKTFVYYEIVNMGRHRFQQRVHQSQLHSIDELKKRLLDVWHGMDQSVIDDVIDGWRKSLWVFMRAKWGHFEQLL